MRTPSNHLANSGWQSRRSRLLPQYRLVHLFVAVAVIACIIAVAFPPVDRNVYLKSFAVDPAQRLIHALSYSGSNEIFHERRPAGTLERVIYHDLNGARGVIVIENGTMQCEGIFTTIDAKKLQKRALAKFAKIQRLAALNVDFARLPTWKFDPQLNECKPIDPATGKVVKNWTGQCPSDCATKFKVPYMPKLIDAE